MLLAGPSQSSSYSYASPRLSNISSRTSLSSKSTSNESIPISSASSRYSLMKSFTVHLNRGTELLKQTVQRAILSKAPTPTEVRTVTPTKYHIIPDLRRTSTDSLEAELCYFRPIRPYPVTLQVQAITRYRKLPKIPMAIQYAPRVREKPFPAFLGKKHFRPSKEASAFCALGPKASPDAGVGFRAPADDTRVSRAKRKRRGAEEVAVAPKVARVTRSSSRKAVPAEVCAEEQERRDFELAKKLQSELNGTARVRNSTASATSGYSLRSKRKSAERSPAPPLRRTTRSTRSTKRTV